MNNFLVSQKESLKQLGKFISTVVKPLQCKLTVEQILPISHFDLVFKSLIETHLLLKSFTRSLEHLIHNQYENETEFWEASISTNGIFSRLFVYIQKLAPIIKLLSRILRILKFKIWINEQFKSIQRTYTSQELLNFFVQPLTFFTLFSSLFASNFNTILDRNLRDKQIFEETKETILELTANAQEFIPVINELKKLFIIDQSIQGDVIIDLVSTTRKVELELDIINIKNSNTKLISKGEHVLILLSDYLLLTKFDYQSKTKRYLYIFPLKSIHLEKITEHHMHLKSNNNYLKIQFKTTEDVKKAAETIKKISNTLTLSIGSTTEFLRIQKLERRIFDLEDIIYYLRKEIILLQKYEKPVKIEENLPKNWKKAQNIEGKCYYYNSEIGKSVWSLKELLAKDWKRVESKTGEIYYYNQKNGETTWDFPLKEIYLPKNQND
ncbi:prp40 pre-mRNA processing factor 40 [Anaeramoeba flamelloides]|uniref:Prp40 pre-mRNA processing factor 40 n=1 Tax=Anaeramoeba flamelloides TaxID=1746091 RepID=A0AAV7ZN91_9EUKA|nr:prp40 pre-mRNA processing factor 40 [Anaeramoeba flamelloides]